jgi:dCMP deaminase
MMRESLDVFFMKIAMMYATRSTCIRRKVGSVIVKDKIQLSAGYNGALSGFEHCCDNPDLCIRTKLNVKSGEHEELCRSSHSEISSLLHANGNLKGSTIYVTAKPCVNCTKAIVMSGIKRIVYFDEYSTGIDNDIANEILKNTQVDILITEELQQFANYLNILRR